MAHGDAEQSQALRDAFASKAAAYDEFSRRTGAVVGRVRPELPRRRKRSSDLVRQAMNLVRGRVFRGERVRKKRERKINKRARASSRTSRVLETRKYSLPDFSK